MEGNKDEVKLINYLYFYNYSSLIEYISHNFLDKTYEDKKDFLYDLLVYFLIFCFLFLKN